MEQRFPWGPGIPTDDQLAARPSLWVNATVAAVPVGCRYTEKADVYSFGIDMWELLTRATPFAGLQPMQVGHVYTSIVKLC